MARITSCLGCGAEFPSDEALIAWLKGKSPNPISCPECGELIPALSLRSRRYVSDRKYDPEGGVKNLQQIDDPDISDVSLA